MAPPEELRRSQRAPLRLRIGYEQMNAFFADYTKNISRGGMFIKTPRPLEVGSRCQFSLSLPALSDPLALEGEVAWVLTAEEARQRGEDAGMGIRFVFPDEALRLDFERLVERMMEESLGPEAARGLLKREALGGDRPRPPHSATSMKAARVPGPTAWAAASPPATSTT